MKSDNKSYKEHIKILAHKYPDVVDKITMPSFYYYNPQWPSFVTSTSEHYHHPCKKVVDDLFYYRSGFTFQKERAFYKKLLESEGI